MLPLVAGLMVRNGDPRTAPYPPNIEVAWRDLEAVRGQLNTTRIDSAIASGKPFRLRLFCGRHSPNWLSSRVGTFPYLEPQSGQTVPMPRFWTTVYKDAYKGLIGALATRYDGKIPLVFVAGAMTYYAEPMLRGLSSQVTRTNLLKAGYTAEKDIVAQQSAMTAHKAFRETRSGVAYNIYQRLNADGSWRMDPEQTLAFMQFQRENLPDSVIGNNSIRSSYIGMENQPSSVYALMKQMGKPLGFQTATIERIGDIAKTIDWGIGQGAHYIELPGGYQTRLSEQQLLDFDRRLKAQV